MLVRAYDPATDRDGVLEVLEAGLREQAQAAAKHGKDPEEYCRAERERLYDDDTGAFCYPEGLWLAESDGQIVGVMQLPPEGGPPDERYRQHDSLLIMELDAEPRDRGVGMALLRKAVEEAKRRGRSNLMVRAIRDSDAHAWYLARGFVPLAPPSTGLMVSLRRRAD
jgi:GNAT superfamily N-acetyltransferase